VKDEPDDDDAAIGNVDPSTASTADKDSTQAPATKEHDAQELADPEEAGMERLWQAARSRDDDLVEQAALACVRRGQRSRALEILMVAYGERITAFAIRMLRDVEAAKDVRQQVFLEAFQGIDKFLGRSKLLSWLYGITYHRCLDHLRRRRQTTAIDDFDVLKLLDGQPDPMMDPDRVAKRRALEDCLGDLPERLRG
jgi:RNA polymerase sigma factor (sigma-70 family)